MNDNAHIVVNEQFTEAYIGEIQDTPYIPLVGDLITVPKSAKLWKVVARQLIFPEQGSVDWDAGRRMPIANLLAVESEGIFSKSIFE